MIARSRSTPEKTQKTAFLRNIEAKLIEKQDRLSYIKRKVRAASESNRISVSEQLLRAEHSADQSIEDLREKIEILKTADDESWPDRRFEVEAAWDDVSQAIKKIVARYP